mmetsp:Transcript_2974/g.4304  ORF Transcript_2974/g.4304 Transcript_2974/m.4304 type:complete len:267 (+) Transcript_2974:240-1040(+)
MTSMITESRRSSTGTDKNMMHKTGTFHSLVISHFTKCLSLFYKFPAANFVAPPLLFFFTSLYACITLALNTAISSCFCVLLTSLILTSLFLLCWCFTFPAFSLGTILRVGGASFVSPNLNSDADAETFAKGDEGNTPVAPSSSDDLPSLLPFCCFIFLASFFFFFFSSRCLLFLFLELLASLESSINNFAVSWFTLLLKLWIDSPCLFPSIFVDCTQLFENTPWNGIFHDIHRSIYIYLYVKCEIANARPSRLTKLEPSISIKFAC